MVSFTSIKVSRFELYPTNNPVSYVVAFIVRHPQNASEKYFEGSIPILEADDLSDVQICMKVWETIKNRVQIWYMSHSRILGHVFDIPEAEFSSLISGQSNLTESNLARYSEVINELQ